MNLTFTIDKYILLTNMLFTRNKCKEYIPLINSLWAKYNLAYNLYDNGRFENILNENYENNLIELKIQTTNLIEETLNTTEFKELYEDTTRYKDWLEKTWLENKNNIIQELTKILKINLPTDEYNVYLVSPKLGGRGRYLGANKILWGDKEKWENYSLVYLAHEWMHGLLGMSDIEHAIIELATDNELRIRLNKKGEYFRENEQSIGHERLRNIEEKILDSWKTYLDDKEIDIFKFVKNLK